MIRRASIIFSLVLLTLSPTAGAFSLRSPFVPKEQTWEEKTKQYEGVPFKHRIYGNLDATVMRVVDGDTLYVEIPSVHPIIGYEIGLRVFGIDTREMSDGGESAKEYVRTIIQPGTKVVLRNLRRGKYFRIVADVLVDGRSLADILLEKDLAYPYYGGTKRPKGWKEEEFKEIDNE